MITVSDYKVAALSRRRSLRGAVTYPGNGNFMNDWRHVKYSWGKAGKLTGWWWNLRLPLWEAQISWIQVQWKSTSMKYNMVAVEGRAGTYTLHREEGFKEGLVAKMDK